MMDIRDHGVYWYIWVCYAIFTLSQDVSLISQFFSNGYKLLGHDDYPIPVITSYPQGKWMDHEYDWNQTKASEKLAVV